jgi:hypothetical protein
MLSHPRICHIKRMVFIQSVVRNDFCILIFVFLQRYFEVVVTYIQEMQIELFFLLFWKCSVLV